MNTSSLADYYAHSFLLKFSLTDRRDYIECTHPGRNDVYFVTLRVYLDEVGNVLMSNFEESIAYGDL